MARPSPVPPSSERARPSASPPPPDSGRRGPRRKRGCIGGVFHFVWRFFWGLIRVTVATSLFFALLTAASYYLIGYYIRGEEEAAPDVRGMPMLEAMAHPQVQSLKLALRLERLEPSEDAPEGDILYQDPKPGARIKARTPLRVVVSSGSRHVRVPESLVSISRREAGIQLRRMNLGVGRVAYVNVPGVANDIVLATDPPPGSGAPPGSKINLLVASDAPNPSSSVPDLKGLTLDLAQQEAERHGLKLEETREVVQEKGEPGTILQQHPPPGEFITQGTRLRVDVLITPTPSPSPTPSPTPTPVPESGGETQGEDGTTTATTETSPEPSEPTEEAADPATSDSATNEGASAGEAGAETAEPTRAPEPKPTRTPAPKPTQAPAVSLDMIDDPGAGEEPSRVEEPDAESESSDAPAEGTTAGDSESYPE